MGSSASSKSWAQLAAQHKQQIPAKKILEHEPGCLALTFTPC